MPNDVASQKYAEQNLAKLDRIVYLLEELIDFQKKLLTLREEQVAQVKKPATKKPAIKKPAIKKPAIKKKK